MRGLPLWMVMVGCSPLSLVSDKALDTEIPDDGSDSDDTKEPVPDDTSPYDTGDPKPDTDETDGETDTLAETGDTGGPLGAALSPVSFSYFAQVGWSDAGFVTGFQQGATRYSTALFIEFMDAVGRVCTIGYAPPIGNQGADPELEAWIAGLGLIGGFRIDPATYTAFPPVDATGLPCSFDPTTILATDPHLEMLRDPLTGDIVPAFVGIGDTLSPIWTQVLRTATTVNPPPADWATSQLRLPFEVTTTVAGAPTVVSNNFELGTYAWGTDAGMVLLNPTQVLDPVTWDAGGRAARGVYLMQSLSISF